MTAKLVIYLLFYGLFAVQTSSHTNSDPAPGRSPGPPAEKEDYNNNVGNSTYILKKNDGTTNSNVEHYNQSISPSSHSLHIDVNPPSSSIVGKDSVNDGNNINKVTHLKYANDEVKTRKINISCRDAISAFISDALVIDANDDNIDDGQKPILYQEAGSGNETSETLKDKIDIKLTIEHDVFDVGQGINCGLMYRGEYFAIL